MEAIYKVIISYPSGKIEELEEVFNDAEEARLFGENYLGQISGTEEFRKALYIGDEFDRPEAKEPYFFVVKQVGKKRQIVFESAH